MLNCYQEGIHYQVIWLYSKEAKMLIFKLEYIALK